MSRLFRRLAGDHRASGQERPNSNDTMTHRSHSFPPQNSSAESQSPPSNSQGGTEQAIGATWSRQGARHSSSRTNTISIDQQDVNSRGTEQDLDRFATRAAMFENAHNFNIEHAPITNIAHQHNHQLVNINHLGNHGLDNLKEFVSLGAVHDSSAQDPERCCHPATRINVLHQMRTWVDDPNAPERILWLNGPAGVGKSAIAQTISYSYGRDIIGATFFFFRSDPVRNDGDRLFPTLAWQLALSVPTVKDPISFSLGKYPDIPSKAIEVQFEQLIAQPFRTVFGGESVTETHSRVIIIDGLDECSDVKLQERILKIIENAVADTRFPLRFVISSRPEAHIKTFFSKCEHSTLQIDLANIEDAYRDIETYLVSEFTRIAVEQELEPEMWPGQDNIDTLVSRSSGQFVYASTIIKYAGDEYESAVTRLNIILGLKLCTGKSPFAELDALYTDILQRQPDQDFLRKFLAVLVACSALSQENLHEDYAKLLGFNNKQLDRKLRGMHSLLKSTPFIDVHHKSFLEFLQDSSRSGKYHISKHFANRRYMEMITDLLVKVASRAIEQAEFVSFSNVSPHCPPYDSCHESGHFQPRFGRMISDIPLEIELPLNDLEEILQPLRTIQDKLLRLPDMSVPWGPRACGECWTFYMIDDILLHLACFRGTTQSQKPRHVGIRPLTAMEEKQDIPQLDLDTCLSLLLAELRSVELSLDMDAIGLARALICFDPTETAMKIRSITDAQNLLELIFCLNKEECFKSWSGAAAHNATRLALAIYGRIPLLPRSFFLNSVDLDCDKKTYQGKAVEIWHRRTSVWRDCFDAFVWGNVSHDSMVPCMGICVQSRMVMVASLPENKRLKEWRQTSNPSVSQIQQTFFEVAKAIEYVYSLGATFTYYFNEDNVYLDSNNHVQMQFFSFRPSDLCTGQFDYDGIGRTSKLENNIRRLGCVFYRVLFNKEKNEKVSFETRPSEPEIPDNLWKLMQWCCAEDLSKRPTMDQVVQEMESWISLGQFTLSS